MCAKTADRPPRWWDRWVPANAFARNVLVMALSSGLGQLILVLSAPILTRVYSTEEMGMLSVYSSLLSIIVVAASFRYDRAVTIAREDRDAATVVLLSILLAVFSSVVMLVAALLFARPLAALLGVPTTAPLLGLLALGILGAAIFQVISLWPIRHRDYTHLARANVSQSAAQVVTQITLGLAGFGLTALLLGQVIGRIAGTGGLLRRFLRGVGGGIRSIRFSEMRSAASRYRDFAMYSSWSSVLNAAGLYLPVILFSSVYGPQVAGWFGLSQRVVAVPLTIVGLAIAQVYLGEASRLVRDDPASLHALVLKLLRRLALLSLIPVILLGLASAPLFGIVFGPNWVEAGRYVQALCIMIGFQFVASPLSQTLAIMERQSLQSLWDITRVVLVCASVLIPARYGAAPFATVLLYGLAMTVCYALLLALVIRETRKLRNASVRTA